MDFHNNEIGRTVYLQNTANNVEAVIQRLLNKTQNAKKVKTLEDISSASENLVYLYPAVKATS
jgi:glutamate synthase domain-containing protein 3